MIKTPKCLTLYFNVDTSKKFTSNWHSPGWGGRKFRISGTQHFSGAAVLDNRNNARNSAIATSSKKTQKLHFVHLKNL